VSNVIRNATYKFHQKFQVGRQLHPFGYKGVNIWLDWLDSGQRFGWEHQGMLQHTFNNPK